jgi:hypothetical protein
MLSIQEQSNLDSMKIQAYRVTRLYLSYVTQATTPEERAECLEILVRQLQTSISGIDNHIDSLY